MQPLKKDPNFKGSVFETLGFSENYCPSCNAHLMPSGICLNACHLTPDQRQRMAQGLKLVSAALDNNSGLEYTKGYKKNTYKRKP